jgi:hypothetical protein
MFNGRTIAEFERQDFEDLWHDRPRDHHDSHVFREQTVSLASC